MNIGNIACNRNIGMAMLVECLTDRASWTGILEELGGYDFAHTWEFHEISRLNGEGSPVLIVCRADGKSLGAWPLLKRDIAGTSYFDLTSVYGHAGPLFGVGVNIDVCMRAMLASMQESGAVSLFSRMHPLYAERLPPASRGFYLGDVVIIDIEPTDNVLGGYRGSHRREITNGLRAGVSTVVDKKCESIREFAELYLQTMRGLGASDYYFFKPDYLQALASVEEFRVVLIHAKIDGKVVASSMFTICGDVMQYYLSGTDIAYRKLAPSKAILARAHEFAIELGVGTLVLGGGLGSRRDALFAFKSGFSSELRPFYVHREVLNSEVYDRLSKALPIARSNYFPAYRG